MLAERSCSFCPTLEVVPGRATLPAGRFSAGTWSASTVILVQYGIERCQFSIRSTGESCKRLSAGHWKGVGASVRVLALSLDPQLWVDDTIPNDMIVHHAHVLASFPAPLAFNRRVLSRKLRRRQVKGENEEMLAGRLALPLTLSPHEGSCDLTACAAPKTDRPCNVGSATGT